MTENRLIEEAPAAVPEAAASPVDPPLETAETAAASTWTHTSPARRLFRAFWSGCNWLFGFLSLLVCLALLAVLPIAQLLSLGYLLEVAGRVARTGKLRNGLIGIEKAGRVGSLLLGVWVLHWIPRFASSMWRSARLIDPHSRATQFWWAALIVATMWVIWHVAAALHRGGRLRDFLWPRPIRFLRSLFRPGAYVAARDALWEFLTGLRLPYYFWLGLRGFLGGLAWLIVPTTMLAAGNESPVAGFLGGMLLIPVVIYLPFLQANMAKMNRYAAIFWVGHVRRQFRCAPVAFLAALLVTLVLALPLYVLKAELIPREAAWLPAILFVVFILPARLLCGWAVARAQRRDQPRARWVRNAVRVVMVPFAAAYVVLVYATQYLSWHGISSLYEQHAFLLPVPFLGG